MTEVAKAYAQGLYALAKEEELTQEILAQLQVLDESFSQEPDFLRILSSAEVAKSERCRILDDSFRGKIHPYLLNFLKILTEKGYIRKFSQCYQAFQDQYNRDNGIICVRAVSAVELSQEQREKLTEKLAQVTGKRIMLDCKTDPACLGGIRLDYDGKRVDGTVANRLATIDRLLKNTVL